MGFVIALNEINTFSRVFCCLFAFFAFTEEVDLCTVIGDYYLMTGSNFLAAPEGPQQFDLVVAKFYRHKGRQIKKLTSIC